VSLVLNSGRIVTRVGRALLCLLVLALCLSRCATLRGQQPPPPPPPRGRPGPPQLDRTGVADHIERVRRQLAESRPNDADVATFIHAANLNLEKAEERLRTNDLLLADRLVAASDAFLRAAQHSQLIEGPRGPRLQAPEIAEHLQRIYFRLQQAEYFAQTSRDPGAKRLPELARKYYERALQAYDRRDWLAADQYAKSSDDTIRGLENLAQAATPLPPRPR
jgi:hypothetical protein